MSDINHLLNLIQSTDMKMKTGSWGRLRQTAGGFLRVGTMIFKNRKPQSFIPNPEELKKIVLSLSQLKGIAMKLGQMMSYFDLAMPDQLKEALSILQTQSPSMPYETVKRQLLEGLPEKKANILLATLQQEPIAAASIGQVHRAEIKGQPVVVKIQYPEIEEAIRNDFSLSRIAGPIAAVLAPGANVSDIITEVRHVFLLECDYLNEADNQQQFCDLYHNSNRIVIPRVLKDFCSRHVLTSEYIEGQSFRQYLASNPSQENRNLVGEALFRFYMGTLFKHGLYNGDPHPGNYLFLPNDRIAILDYGCVIHFDFAFRNKMLRLARAVHQDNQEELRQCYEELNMKRPGHSFREDLARDFLRAYFGPLLENREQRITTKQTSDFRELVTKKQQLMKLHIPKEFIFLLRIRFGLLSILSEIGSIANWNRLERSYLE